MGTEKAEAPRADGAVALPGHGSCYVCGTDNPAGLGLTFFLRDGVVSARWRFNEKQQGPPAHAHGGSIAAVLDELMGAAVWCAGHPVVAARLEVDFRKAIPLGAEIAANARVASKSGRKVWAEAELTLSDGTTGARARGLFVEARHLFQGDFFVPRY